VKTMAPAALLVISLASFPARAAQESHLDEVRAQATARFGSTLASIRKEVDHVDAARRRYQAGCRGKVTTVRPVYPQGIPLDHPPTVSGGLVSGVPPAATGGYTTPLHFEIQNEKTAECRILRSDIIAGVTSVEHRLADMSEEARRAGIYPGVMRDLRIAQGLNPLD
jgi:hypothetical protein